MTRQKYNIFALLLGLAVSAIGNSASADTVAAIVDTFNAPQVSMNLRHWCPLNIPGPGQPGYPPSGILTLGTTPAQFQVQRTGGTFAGTLIGNSPNRFVAFCLEPLQQVSFANETYTLKGLSSGGTDLGTGMGFQRAAMIQELFGRFYPDFSQSISQEQAAALQIATWEILREKVDSNCVVQNLSYSDLDVNSGDIFFNYSSNGVVSLAQTYLDELDGTGKKASYLRALTLAESAGQPTQDLLVQIIPEPGTLVLVSIGIAGLAIFRRKKSVK
jgi:hypothetical protein